MFKKGIPKFRIKAAEAIDTDDGWIKAKDLEENRILKWLKGRMKFQRARKNIVAAELS